MVLVLVVLVAVLLVAVVTVAVLVVVVTSQSSNSLSWKRSMASFKCPVALQSPLKSLTRPEPLQPKTSPPTSPRVTCLTIVLSAAAATTHSLAGIRSSSPPSEAISTHWTAETSSAVQTFISSGSRRDSGVQSWLFGLNTYDSPWTVLHSKLPTSSVVVVVVESVVVVAVVEEMVVVVLDTLVVVELAVVVVVDADHFINNHHHLVNNDLHLDHNDVHHRHRHLYNGVNNYDDCELDDIHGHVNYDVGHVHHHHSDVHHHIRVDNYSDGHVHHDQCEHDNDFSHGNLHINHEHEHDHHSLEHHHHDHCLDYNNVSYVIHNNRQLDNHDGVFDDHYHRDFHNSHFHNHNRFEHNHHFNHDDHRNRWDVGVRRHFRRKVRGVARERSVRQDC